MEGWCSAVGWNWQTDLQDRVVRDVVDPRAFAELCRRSGVENDQTVVVYGDNNNWFAAWAFWQFKYHSHKDVRLMNGGRKLWEIEKRPQRLTQLRVREAGVQVAKPPGRAHAHAAVVVAEEPVARDERAGPR